MEQAVIPVVLACNDNYARYCSVVIQSVLDHSSPDRTYHIWVFHTELTPESIATLEGMSIGERFLVRCMDVNDYVVAQAMRCSDCFPQETYYRILIPDVLPQYEKVLYLDCDVVAQQDVADLVDIDMGERVLAAVKNATDRSGRHYFEKELGIPIEEYFNAGVLLIHTSNCRNAEIGQKCIDLLSQRSYACLDQDVLNLACKGKTLMLPYIWNYQCSQPSKWHEAEELQWQPGQGIIHHLISFKPWNSMMGKRALPFWKSAVKTPYADRLLKELDEMEDFRVEPYYLKRCFVEGCRSGLIRVPSFLLCAWRCVLGILRRK